MTQGDEGSPFKAAVRNALIDGLMAVYVKREPGVKVEDEESNEPHHPFNLGLLAEAEGACNRPILPVSDLYDYYGSKRC